MSVFVRCLTLLTMLLHSVYGCGWHHIHGCMSGCLENSENKHPLHCVHSHAPGHSHHDAHDSETPTSHDQHSSECDHTECRFVSTAAAAIVAPPECVLWIVAPEADSRAQSLVKLDSGLRPTLSSDTHAPEFCARIQVWRT